MIALKKKKKKNQLRENFGTTPPVNFLISIEQFLLLNAKYGNTKSSMYIFQILLQWKKRYKGENPQLKNRERVQILCSRQDSLSCATPPEKTKQGSGKRFGGLFLGFVVIFVKSPFSLTFFLVKGPYQNHQTKAPYGEEFSWRVSPWFADPEIVLVTTQGIRTRSWIDYSSKVLIAANPIRDWTNNRTHNFYLSKT